VTIVPIARKFRHRSSGTTTTLPAPGAPETPTEAPAPAPVEQVTIQVGSFSDKGNADILVQDLREHGVAASAQTTQQGGNSLYKVKTGSYQSREQAEAAAEGLRRKGYNAVIVPRE
jgi:DedD protein